MLSLTHEELVSHFPFKTPRETQLLALERIAATEKGALIESPTGSGKTSVGMAVLRALVARGEAPLFYVTPTKTLVEQVARDFSDDCCVMMGRNEYPCLYYENHGQSVSAMEAPCHLVSCPHRVDQETGDVAEKGVEPCPYLFNKYRARQSSGEQKVIVCTTAFFLLNRLFVPRWKEIKPACIVLDEAHRLAEIARRTFEYSISDGRLNRLIEVLRMFDANQASIFRHFRDRFVEITKARPTGRPQLFKEAEIESLLQILCQLDQTLIKSLIKEATTSGQIDIFAERQVIKLLDTMSGSIPRFINLLTYALPTEYRKPLNYVYGYYEESDEVEADSGRRSRYQMKIKGYHVAPLIRLAFGENVIGYSATIGDPNIFEFETGLRLPFHTFDSEFSSEKTRVFMPIDTPNLAAKGRRRDDLKKAMKSIVQASLRFKEYGFRSLAVVVSEEERQRLVEMAQREGLMALSYTKAGEAKAVVRRFKKGEGDILIGTAAQYGEGIDLPNQIAPVIFFLRPGFQRPDDPMSQFEQQRFSDGHCWALWRWRVMIQALQVRGRNIRNDTDTGVCIFISQQFRRFLYSSLPEWLKPAYEGKTSMEEVVDSTIELLR